MRLSELVKMWDILHQRDTGALGFCDLVDAAEMVVEVENDLLFPQPTLPP